MSNNYEHHNSVNAAFADVEQFGDEGRTLRWKVRILVQHYAGHREENFDANLGAFGVTWCLNGRPGISMGERQWFIAKATEQVQGMLALDPADPELAEALEYCQQLDQLAKADAAKDEAATDHFSAWSQELHDDSQE